MKAEPRRTRIWIAFYFAVGVSVDAAHSILASFKIGEMASWLGAFASVLVFALVGRAMLERIIGPLALP